MRPQVVIGKSQRLPPEARIAGRMRWVELATGTGSEYSLQEEEQLNASPLKLDRDFWPYGSVNL